MEQVLKKEKQIQAKPIMKWAGGKTQMLGDIMPKIPQKYGKYIEPFIGGGALFFALSPDKSCLLYTSRKSHKSDWKGGRYEN